MFHGLDPVLLVGQEIAESDHWVRVLAEVIEFHQKESERGSR